MGNSFDLGTVTLETLKGNGYDERLIEALESENFEYLERGDIKVAMLNKDFAEPLIYACINSRKIEMYQIYAHLEERVQSQLLTDYNLSSLILLNAPEVIENTPLAEDKNAILANVNENPQIIDHISDKLVEDKQFIAELSEKNPEVVREMLDKYPVDKIVEANPDIVKNPVFMAEALSKDINAIKFADKEMKNNYEVFETSAKENDEVAKYILEHIEEFGDNAVKGAKDGSTERVRIDTVDTLKGLLEKYGNEGNLERQIKNQELREKEDDGFKLKSVIQLLKKSRWASLPENELNIILDTVELRKVELERQLQNPELVISQEEFGALPTPDELKLIIEKSQIKDKEAVLERVAKYEEFHTMAKEHKSKERKPKEKVEVPRETQEERDERLRTTDQEKIATDRFIKYRGFIENKGRVITPRLLKEQLENSKLKDDKEAIAWLEEYTRFYEQQQEKVGEQTQEHNAELSVSAITLTVNDRGIEKVVTYDHTVPDGIKLTPEQMHQLEADLASRNVERENVQEVEAPKRGIAALREGPEKDGQDR